MKKELLFDKRLIDRHIKLGYITQKDVDEYFAGLEEGCGLAGYKGHEVADLVDFQESQEVKWVFVAKPVSK